MLYVEHCRVAVMSSDLLHVTVASFSTTALQGFGPGQAAYVRILNSKWIDILR